MNLDDIEKRNRLDVGMEVWINYRADPKYRGRKGQVFKYDKNTGYVDIAVFKIRKEKESKVVRFKQRCVSFFY